MWDTSGFQAEVIKMGKDFPHPDVVAGRGRKRDTGSSLLY